MVQSPRDYRNSLVKTLTASGQGLNANYSCSPLRGRPNLHLSKQRGRRRHTASGSGQPITKNRLTLSLPAYEHAVTYGRPLNLKMINLRCQTKYSVRFLPLC